MNDHDIEQEIQAKGLTAPRVTPADIEANIVGEHYFTAAEATEGPSVGQIARVAHEVNRAYCQALGDASQQEWEDAPQWQKDSAILGVELYDIPRLRRGTPGTKDSAILGVELYDCNPDAGPQASHESWMAQKLAEGWEYGPVKDPESKQHPCIVPFDELPREQQVKDYLFRGVVHAVAGAFQGAPQHESLGLLTFCVLVLRNGFTVTGESACASPENFDAEIGRKIARQNAVQKLWPLMGYALKERLAGQA